ncbi:FAD:protein FMN transferase [Ideonella sp. B7]|uniref:FAD:protein FMN transferase n=1 Tax=Ideonella benzenivorans TaxID=2831643 RepID=UPI001CEDC1C7|nr:FAD:protein FMN transferase [Ideonella benzenivorans]MCA6216553.1 FAD:protein FMN transferase [Ideonella benzenivorans]
MSSIARSAPPTRVLIPAEVQGTPAPWGQVLHALDGATMGTTWSVRVWAGAGLPPTALRRAIQAVLDDVIAQMSTWDETALICRFNRLPAGRAMTLPESFATVLEAALHVARRSAGAFDPTVGAAVGRWGFGPAHLCEGLPACAAQGWQRLRWAAEHRRLTQPGGGRLDLSAIAKGHAVDRVSALLRDSGLPHHLVEIGGELRGEGLKPSGQPWWVDLESPDPACPLPPTRVALHGLSVATSGDYRRWRTADDGRRLSHTLDPRTGAPVTHDVASVTVLHPSAMWADAWATALMVLGPQDGLALAEAEGLAALWIERPGLTAPTWRDTLSPALRAWLA